MSWIFPLLALLATLFGFYLQRRESEKSQKPIPQIILGDTERQIYVRVQNNGAGPLIVERILFFRDGIEYPGIESCITLDPKSYMHDTEISPETPKIVPPRSYIEVFGTVFEEHEDEEAIMNVRKELSEILLKVVARDIYGHKIRAERNLHWFVRHDKKTTA